MEVEQPVEEQVQEAPLDRETAIKKALSVALTRGTVVKGISEVLKALEAQKVKVVFLAENCDNDQYKQTVEALAKEHKVPLIKVDTWENLKDYCKLGLLSSTIKEVAEKKGKEGKIKPRCSSAAILDWGEDTDAKKYLEEEPKKEETKKPESKKEEKKTETKKEVVKKNPSLSPMYSVPKDKEEEEKNRINQVVVDRLNEYRAALDYFQTNELGEQRIDATNKAKLICIELKKIQDGKWREVNEFKLPDPITPEYIYGYKKEERIERFKKVILDYDRQRKEIQTTLNDKLAALKKLPASKLKKIQAVVTKDLNEMKSKKEKLDKIINLLKEKMQDSWVPAPLFIEQDREIKTEKIDKDIPEFHVKIIFVQKKKYMEDVKNVSMDII